MQYWLPKYSLYCLNFMTLDVRSCILTKEQCSLVHTDEELRNFPTRDRLEIKSLMGTIDTEPIMVLY